MGKNKNITFIDLFAGAGGFGLGFKQAGYDLLLSLEIDKWASDTLRYNDNSRMRVVTEDIRNFRTLSEIEKIISDKPQVIIGGPPCQGFSISGPAKKDPKDPRNSLFKNFALWVELLRPNIFIMENVKGLLSRKNTQKEYVIEIIKNTFIDLDYEVEIWLLNAAEYGVPQIRERVFIIGNNLSIDKIFPPKKTHSYNHSKVNNPLQRDFFKDDDLHTAITLWEAISDLPKLEAGCGEEEQYYTSPPENPFQEYLRGKQDILFNHVAMNHSKRLVERFKHIQWGESSANVPDEHRAHSRNGNGKLSNITYDQNNRRLHPHKPSHTIAASFYANFVHPFQNRNLTAREGARIQTFPDSYKFMGKRTVPSSKLLEREGRLDEIHLSQYNQIGNAVPPLLAKRIAEHLEKFL